MAENKINHQGLLLTNKDGLSIYTQAWLPQSEPRANLVIVHGLGEHSGRYQHVAEFFVEKRLAVFAFDHQGHGQSDGKRGHVNAFSDLIADLEMFLQHVNELSPDKPTFLFGHSMGATIVLLYLLEHQDKVDAVVVSAPAVRIKMGPPTFVKELVPQLAKMSPAVTINSGLKPEWVSHDTSVVEAYKADELTHPHISLSLFSGMYNGGKHILEQADKITLPIFILYGSEDKIVDGDAIKATFEKISSADKKLLIFQDDFHEVHNEADQLEEFEQIWQWLEKKL